jgi:uncharacterized protein YifN (PemK superfamily)
MATPTERLSSHLHYGRQSAKAASENLAKAVQVKDSLADEQAKELTECRMVQQIVAERLEHIRMTMGGSSSVSPLESVADEIFLKLRD